MLRFRRVAALAVAVLCASATGAHAHEGNPNFRSEIRSIAPPIDGLDVRVANFDDRLELHNRSGRTVVIEGYRGEPYFRVLGDGTVQVNRRSPTLYLNEDRFAEGVEVPPSAGPRARPAWRTVDRSGRYDWHDHRIHWMSRSLPPQVKDESERTKIFDWRVPVEVGGRSSTIAGTLTWVGKDDSGFPLAAALSLGAAVLAGGLVVVLVRRRRKAAPRTEQREAW